MQLPRSQTPAHWPPQPSETPHRTPGGHRGTHTQRPAAVSQTSPSPHPRPTPHEGPSGHALGMFVPHGIERGSITHAGMHRHRPPSQAVRGGQVVPQPPQFESSEVTFTQRSLHSVSDIGQRQIPATQVVPKGHWMPHAPQWFPSFERFTQRPSQSVIEGAHMGPPSLAPLSISPASLSHELTHSHRHDVVLQRSPGLHPVPRPQTTPAGHSLGTSLPHGKSPKRSGGGHREMHTQRRSVRSQRSPTSHP